MTGPLSDAERGQTMGTGARWAVRLVVVLVILAGVGATIVVANGVPPRVGAFLAGAVGVVTGEPASASSGTAATAAPATASSTSSPSGSPTDSPSASPGTASPTTAAEALIDPRADPDGFAAAVGAARAAADPAATSPDASELAAYQRALEVTRGSSTSPDERGDDPDEVVQSRLVRNHDNRWALLARLGLVVDRPDTVDYVAPATRVSLDDLIARGTATRVDATTVLVTKSVFVARGAVLDLTAPGQSIRLQSGAHGFAAIVAWGGTVTLAGTEGSPVALTSWDPEAQGPDLRVSDGRSYLRVHEGTFTADWASTSDLGFWSGRTGGLALTGTDTIASTGSVTNSVISAQHIGLFLAYTSSPTIRDTVVRGSAEQGVELANGTWGATIDGATVSGSGADGIDVRRGVDDLAVTSSTISRNGDYGLRIDGRASADTANSAGFSVESAWGLTVSGSTIADNRAGGVYVRGTGGVSLAGNTVDQRTVGLRLADAQGEVTGNTVHVEPGDGIVLEGAATVLSVSRNSVTGEGPSAIALPADDAGEVTQSANTVSGWSGRWEALLWVEAHPLALLWGLLLVIPLVGVGFVFYRMRRQRTIRELVEATTIALAAAEKERYDATRRPVEDDSAVASLVGAGIVTHGEGDGGGRADTAGGGGGGADRRAPERPPGRVPVRPVAAVSTARPAGGAYRPGRETTIEPRYAPSRAVGAAPRAATTVSAGAAAPGSTARASRPVEAGVAATASGAAGDFGRFSSVEDLAVAAVLDAGKPIDRVAHALRLPVGSVAGWVAKARRARGDV